MKLQNVIRAGVGVFAVTLLLAVAAQAAPISMVSGDGDGVVRLDGVMGSFDLSMPSGNTATNTLVFQIQGNPPAIGVAAIVFDGATVLSATELADPSHLLSGLAVPSTGVVAGVLVDFGAPSQASFQVVLSSLPSTASVYSLNLTDTSPLFRSNSWQKLSIEKEQVRFSTAAIPEPGAALCFATGLTFVASRLRRRS